MARPDTVDTELLAAEGWRTPNTYTSCEFGTPPAAPGIYLFAVFPPPIGDPAAKGIVAYVGKSKCLSRRLAQHPTVRSILLEAPDAHIERWFLVMPANEIYGAEIEAIRRFNPPYNIQHRLRGLFHGTN